MTHNDKGMEKQGVIKQGVTPVEITDSIKRGSQKPLEDHTTTRLLDRLADKRSSRT